MLKIFETTCEVWVKPWFRKARPKIKSQTWAARSYEDVLLLLREHYSGKRFKLLEWREIKNK